MAYLNFADPFAGTASLPLARAVEARFERREWSVIALARNDGLASLAPPSRFARLMGRLFGGDIDRRLADPRLEALRRFAVLAWYYGYTLPVSAMKALTDVGYSRDHIELLLAIVANDRQRPRRGVA